MAQKRSLDVVDLTDSSLPSPSHRLARAPTFASPSKSKKLKLEQEHASFTAERRAWTRQKISQICGNDPVKVWHLVRMANPMKMDDLRARGINTLRGMMVDAIPERMFYKTYAYLTRQDTNWLMTEVHGKPTSQENDADLPVPNEVELRKAIREASAVTLRCYFEYLCKLSPALSRAAMRLLAPYSSFAKSTLQKQPPIARVQGAPLPAPSSTRYGSHVPPVTTKTEPSSSVPQWRRSEPLASSASSGNVGQREYAGVKKERLGDATGSGSRQLPWIKKEQETTQKSTPVSSQQMSIQTPFWLQISLADLKRKHPESSIEALRRRTWINTQTQQPAVPCPETYEDTKRLPPHIQPGYMWHLKCNDCPDALYPQGGDASAYKFEAHLLSDAHEQNVAQRLSGTSAQRLKTEEFSTPTPSFRVPRAVSSLLQSPTEQDDSFTVLRTCKQCKVEYNINDPKEDFEDACMYHPGRLKPDWEDEFWSGKDDEGDMSPDEDQLEHYKYSCCSENGNDTGCRVGPHVPDS